MDESGRIVSEMPSDAPSFSNLDPTTSDAEAMAPVSNVQIWGTNVSTHEIMAAFRGFLRNYTKKYRMYLDGVSEEEVRLDPEAESKEYVQLGQNMLALHVTNLNLDMRNLKAYPPTVKLWQQTQDYPQDVVPMMDQEVKNFLLELAEAEMARRQASQSQSAAPSSRTRIMSSEPPVPSSELGGHDAPTPRPVVPAETDLIGEVINSNYRVRPYGLDQTTNMRELNPSGS